MDRDVVDQEPLVGDGEDDDSHDGSVVLGDGDLAVADDRGVVVGHRAGQHPDALDVGPVGGLDERGNARDVRLGRRPEPVAAGLVGRAAGHVRYILTTGGCCPSAAGAGTVQGESIASVAVSDGSTASSAGVPSGVARRAGPPVAREA
jgi:hypothetical protein